MHVPGLVVNLVAEARCVDDCERYARAFLIQLELCCANLISQCYS